MADTPPRLEHAPLAPLELVEWRIDGTPSQARNGQGMVARFLPYLDAAAVAELLDEWVGPARWRDEYEQVDLAGRSVLWCHLSILDPETGEWVTKTDVGVASTFEAQKGLVSDSFKRAACLKWGAGRNVYELPNLWAPCRSWTSNGKTQGAPNNETLPAILKQLNERGYNAEGSRVGGGDEPSAEQPSHAGNPSPGAADGEGAAPSESPRQGSDGAPSSEATALEAEKRNRIGDLWKQMPEQHHEHVVGKLRERQLIKRKTKQASTTADAQHLDTIIETLEKAVEFYKAGPPAGVDPATGEKLEEAAPDSLERLRATLNDHEAKLTSEQLVTWAEWFEEQFGNAELADLDTDQLGKAVAHIVTIF